MNQSFSQDEGRLQEHWARVFTPRLMALCMSAQISLWWFCHWRAWHTPDRAFWRLTEGLVRYGGTSLACVMMIVLTLLIAREHRTTRWLHTAWLALTAHAAVSLMRAWFEFALYHGDSYPLGRWGMGLLVQVVIVSGTLLLLFALLAMMRAYQLVGLGLKIERRDWALASVALALLPLLYRHRSGFNEAASPLVFTRYLQQFGIYLLPVAVMLGLVLQRQIARMGGGQLATALRLLTVYVFLRAVLVMTSTWFMGVAYTEPIAFLSNLNSAAWQAVLWLAALASAKRAEMIFHAVRELQRNRATRSLAFDAVQ